MTAVHTLRSMMFLLVPCHLVGCMKAGPPASASNSLPDWFVVPPAGAGVGVAECDTWGCEAGGEMERAIAVTLALNNLSGQLGSQVRKALVHDTGERELTILSNEPVCDMEVEHYSQHWSGPVYNQADWTLGYRPTDSHTDELSAEMRAALKKRAQAEFDEISATLREINAAHAEGSEGEALSGQAPPTNRYAQQISNGLPAKDGAHASECQGEQRESFDEVTLKMGEEQSFRIGVTSDEGSVRCVSVPFVQSAVQGTEVSYAVETYEQDMNTGEFIDAVTDSAGCDVLFETREGRTFAAVFLNPAKRFETLETKDGAESDLAQ